MKVFKAIVNGTEYEIEMELVSENGRVPGETIMQQQMIRRGEPAPASAPIPVVTPAPAAASTATPAPAAPAPAPAAAPAPAPAPAATPVPASAASSGGKTINSPLPGNILAINVKNGDAVKKGQVLFVIEAMKMENEVMAPADGTVADVSVAVGQTVNTDEMLCSLQ